MRKLASIQRILKIEPIPNADAIEVATVLGWHCVIKKDEFKVNDLVVFIEPDSICPDRPEFEFLKDSQGKMKKIRTVKLRGQISQGLVMPLSILPNHSGNPEDYCEDFDVTEILGITKYEPEVSADIRDNQKVARYVYPKWIPKFIATYLNSWFPKWFKRNLATKAGESFPYFVPKTDETRVQVLQKLLDKYQGTKCYITEKLDGSSITIYLKNGEFGVCSRNIDLAETEGNTFWDTVRTMDIEEKMRKYAEVASVVPLKNFALQGELLGEGIQSNKLKIKGHTIRFFNVFNIDKQQYLDFHEFEAIICVLALETVPVLSTDFTLTNNIDELVEMSKGSSTITPQTKREGIVIRPLEETEDRELHCQLVRNRISFKAINPEFLLKYGE